MLKKVSKGTLSSEAGVQGRVAEVTLRTSQFDSSILHKPLIISTNYQIKPFLLTLIKPKILASLPCKITSKHILK